MSSLSGPADGAPRRSQPQRIDQGVLLTDLGQGLRTTLAGAVESPGRVALARATAQPGADGVLRAPLSGQPCVWFRALVAPSARWLPLSFSTDYRTLPAVAPSNLPYVGVLSDATSTTPFVVADGVQSVEVWPTHTDVDTHVQTVNAQTPDGEVHVEWIVPVGAPVLVVGAVGRPDGETAVLQHPAGPPMVTTKDEKWLGDRARAESGQDPRLRSYQTIGLLIGVAVALAVLLLALVPLLR